MKVNSFLRDHAPTILMLLSVGVSTYTSVAVLGTKLEALTHEFRKSETALLEDQNNQWEHLMLISSRVQDNETACLLLEERLSHEIQTMP